MKLFIFGLGNVAAEIVRQWQILGFQIAGTHREIKNDDPIPHFAFNETTLLNHEGLEALESSNAVLICIPPSEMMIDPVYRFYSRVLSSSKNLKWLGYLSTTAVYGDHHCNWVTEETPPTPQTDRGVARVLAENQWLSQSTIPSHIFRLSGIYAFGKSAIARAENNAPIIYKPVHLFNRIHVADIAQAIIASIFNPTPQQIYNVSDDLPAAGDEVLSYAYELLGKTPPEPIAFKQAELSDMAREFYSECKRVNADKVKNALGIQWLYPDYKAGLMTEIAKKHPK